MKHLIPLLCLLLPLSMAHASVLTVKDPPYNAVGDGVRDDTAALQHALNDGSAVVPCGAYRVTQTLTMPTNATLQGMGPCSLLVLDASLPLYAPFSFAPVYFGVTNANYIQGNSGITVRDIAIDATQLNDGNTHSLHFRHTADVLVDHVTTYGGGDGVAFTQGHNFVVRNSHVSRALNAALDSWDSTQGGLFEGNVVYGQGVGLYGILVTATDTLHQGGTSSGVKVVNNTVRNVLGVGIWFQAGSPTAQVQDSAAFGNTVLGPMLIGIRIGEGTGVIIAHNHVEGTQMGIATSGEFVAGGSDGVMQGNVLRNIGPQGAVVLGYGSTGWTVGGNVGIGGNTTLQMEAWPNLISTDNQLQVQWVW